MKIKSLLSKGPIVVSIGVRDFARDVERQGAKVVRVSWRPPRRMDPELDRILKELM